MQEAVDHVVAAGPDTDTGRATRGVPQGKEWTHLEIDNNIHYYYICSLIR